MKQARSNSYITLLAVASLLIAQCLLLVHQTDLKHHKAGQNCELCLHAANLTSTHAPGPTVPLPDVGVYFAFESSPDSPVVTRSYSAPQARAPPVLL